MANRSKGFSIVEIILIVAVVALLGFVGWRVWEAQKDKGNNAQNTQQNQQSNESKGEELNPDGYLHIKELGVKIKLTEGIRDAVYEIADISTPQSQIAYLTTHSLSKEDPSCSVKESPLGKITKTLNDTDGFGNKRVVDNERTFKLENAYFVYTSPQSQCSQNKNTVELSIDQITEFSNAFKSIELE